MASQSLAGKVVVITGASSGIGAELARHLQAAGAFTVLAARSEDKLKELVAQLGDNSMYVVMDVTKRADHEKLLAAAIERFGHIDVYVNNAGRGISRIVEEITDEDFDDMMLVNTKSALYGMQTAVKHFKERGQGQVINVSSMLGRLPFASFRSAYCAAKHAMNSLTCSMRVDMQNQGFKNIHVSLFSPGAVATDFGLNALHGGVDNRKLPNAQPVEEVAVGLVQLIENPRADVYSREVYRSWVANYYSAEDVAVIESRPPFAASPFAAAAPAAASQ